MRKIKITALVLAVLMVMAAFAGCAGKADFEDLRQDFEDHINQSNKNQEELAGDIKDNSDKIEEILGALGNITGTLEGVNGSLADLKDQLEKADEENKANAEADKEHAALQAAKEKANADLDKMNATVETDRAHYSDADYAALVNAIADAKKAIDAATTIDEVTAAFNKADEVFKAKATIMTILANYYNAVYEKVTLESKDLIDEIDVYLNGKSVNGKHEKPAIQVKYGFDYNDADKIGQNVGTLPEAILEYDTGRVDEAKLPIKVNLINELQDAIAAYKFLVNTVVDLAEDADKRIDAIGTVYLSFEGDKATNKFVVAADAAVIDVLVELYTVDGVVLATGQGKHVRFLADENVKLITKYADYEKAVARLAQLQEAYNKFESMMEIGGTIDDKYDAFGLYKYTNVATAETEDGLTERTYRADFTLKASVYDIINKQIAAWKAAYDIDFGNEVIIINKVESTGETTWTKDAEVVTLDLADRHTVHSHLYWSDHGFLCRCGLQNAMDDMGWYGAYLWNSALVELRTEGYAAFASIKTAISTVNNIRSLNAENVKSFEDTANSITLWIEKYEIDNYNFAKVIEKYSLDNQATKGFTYAGNDTAQDLVDFEFPETAVAANGYAVDAKGDVITGEKVAYEAILREHYTAARNYVALFRFAFKAVRNFVEADDLYFAAKDEAIALNERVTKIVYGVDQGVSVNSVSVLPLVLIDGSFKPVSIAEDGTQTDVTFATAGHNDLWVEYKNAELKTLAETAPRITFQTWYITWKQAANLEDTNPNNDVDVDLSPMLNQAEFDRKWDLITARIATQKATYVGDATSGITMYLTNIYKSLYRDPYALTDAKKNGIDFRNEADILAAWNLYNEGKETNNLSTLRDFGPTEADALVYSFDLILGETHQDNLVKFKAKLNELNAELTALNGFYNNLKTYAKWNYETDKLTLLQSTEKDHKVKKPGDPVKYMRIEGDFHQTHSEGDTVLNLLLEAERRYLELVAYNNLETETEKAIKLNELHDSFKVQNYMALTLRLVNVLNGLDDADNNTENNIGKVEFEIFEYANVDTTKTLEELLARLNKLIAEYKDDTSKGWNITKDVALANITLGESERTVLNAYGQQVTVVSDFQVMDSATAVSIYLNKDVEVVTPEVEEETPDEDTSEEEPTA